MSYLRTSILTLFLATVSVLPAIADGNIVIAAQETEAMVAPRPGNLRLINLPALTFSLRAALRCRGAAESVTFSIADTYQTLLKDEVSDQRAAEMSLTVPARQLALAATSRFCVAGNSESGNTLLVAGITTAQASLRCASETGTSVHYASVPLQVMLTCDRDAETTQESSPER